MNVSNVSIVNFEHVTAGWVTAVMEEGLNPIQTLSKMNQPITTFLALPHSFGN